MEIENQTPEVVKSESSWKDLLKFALLALVIIIPIRLFVVEPFVVSGLSMFPTFNSGDYLIVDKISYELGTPKRDDVVVFRFPGDPKMFYIKRIIGLPGETVDIKGAAITITNSAHPDGFTLDQPFIQTPSNNDAHYVLKDNEYFVMGDNRTASSDSRVWGPVDRNLMVGRVLVRLLPINHLNILPGSYKQTE